MFNKTKKRYEGIKNFSKTTFDDMKQLKNIKDLDGSEFKLIGLFFIALFVWSFLVSLLPILLQDILTTVIVLIGLANWKRIYGKKN